MGPITLPNVKAYCIAIVIRRLWYWGWVDNRSVEQNREFRNRSTQTCLINDAGATEHL